MTLARDILTICAVIAGGFFFLAGTVGLLRFPDALTRLHALTKADNLGLGLVALGLVIQAETILGACKLIAVWLLVLFASATVSQLIAQSIPLSSFPRKRESMSPDRQAGLMDSRLRGHDGAGGAGIRPTDMTRPATLPP